MVLATVNVLTVTYFLAIERASFLQTIFPSFVIYAISVVFIGIPILIAIGYAHYKKIPAISEEVEVTTEANPYLYKIPPGWNAEVVFPFYLTMTEMLLKVSKNEKLSEDDIKQINELQNKIKTLLEGGYLGNYSRKPKL